MKQYISELMPLIVEALLDGAAATKREVAVATLGQVVQSTGYVACHFVTLIKIVVLFFIWWFYVNLY
jgi:phosphatidylinositol kinase/protein kinase (PI-3  family)